MSQRSCERIFGVSQNTIAKLFEEAGDMAIQHIADLKNLTIETVQADELYSFVAAREFNADDMAVSTPDAGTIWTYLAVCAKTKLIFAYHLGDQNLADATAFGQKVASKLKRKVAGGEFVVRPTIITDGLHAYPTALDRAFGSYANIGVLQKSYTKTDKKGNRLPGSRYKGAQRIVKAGEIDERDIHTSYVERTNLNVRMGVRRYGRRTNAFSKTMLNHERHIALWIMYRNLCWIPRPRRPGKDAPRQWEKRLPAAMEVGLTDGLVTVDDLLDMTDEFVRARKADEREVGAPVEALVNVLPDDSNVELAPTHWVYRSFKHRSTKVHTAGCSNCRDGVGKHGNGNTPDGEWLPFYALEVATGMAEALEPYQASVCKVCIVGEYTKLEKGRRGQ